jgi:hypothetical protein
MSKVYSLVPQEERHLSLYSTQITEAATLTAKEGPKGKNAENKPKSQSICDHCGKSDHLKSWCYELIGHPVGHPKHAASKPENHQ